MRRRDRNTTIIVLATSGLVIAMFLIGMLSPARNFVDQMLSPLQRTTRRLSSAIGNGAHLVTSIGSLDRQNQDLSRQVDDLKRQLADVREVEKENELLRSQLDLGTSRQYDTVPARVLGSSTDVVRTTFQIDKGSTSNITEGMAVIAGSGLVGVVDSVDKYTATVVTVNDPVFKISAITQSVRATGIVRGQLGTGLKMEKISQNEPIQTGETVVTSGSGQVPKGIIIGTIESIERADNAIFQGANLKPAVNVSRLEVVFVIRGVK